MPGRLCHPYLHPGPLGGQSYMATTQTKKKLMGGDVWLASSFLHSSKLSIHDGECPQNVDTVFRFAAVGICTNIHTLSGQLPIHSHKYFDPVLPVLKEDNLSLLLQQQCPLGKFPRLLWDSMNTEDMFLVLEFGLYCFFSARNIPFRPRRNEKQELMMCAVWYFF